MEEHPALAGLDRNDAEELGSDIADFVAEAASGVSMPIRWAIEEAVLRAAGHEPEE